MKIDHNYYSRKNVLINRPKISDIFGETSVLLYRDFTND